MTRPPSRRAVLTGAAAVGALAATASCRRKGAAREPDLRGDLRHLIAVIGPWTRAEQAQADALIPRYLTDERLRRFEPDRAAFAQLAARFADLPPASDAIDLAALAAPERAALIALTTDLYGVPQVRFAVAGTPEPGQCMADPRWQSQPPPR